MFSAIEVSSALVLGWRVRLGLARRTCERVAGAPRVFLRYD